MRSISTILLGGVVAFGVAGVAMAQDAAQPAGSPQAGPARAAGGGFADAPRHPPAIGGAYGVISSVTPKGFVITQATDHPVPVELAPNTTYRLGNARATKRAIKVGDRVRVVGPVDTGAGANRTTTITANYVVLQPVEGAGSVTSMKVAAAVLAVLTPVQNAQGAQGGQGARGAGGPGAGPAQGGAPAGAPGAGGARQAPDLTRQGLPVPARHIGDLNPDWGDAADSRTTIAAGVEAERATEVGMAAPYSAGGLVDRVVKEPDGTMLVHNIGTGWPHHIFVSRDFKLIGAAN
jgi:hypothetical protein